MTFLVLALLRIRIAAWRISDAVKGSIIFELAAHALGDGTCKKIINLEDGNKLDH
jgi:hypothetical protein